MIVSCPACSARYRLNPERLQGKRATLRCVKCREIFKVGEDRPAAIGNGIEVLVAHSDVSLCSAVGEILDQHQITYRLTNEGNEALQLMSERPPHVALIDVALPGLFAFEMVDKVRKRPGLGEVKLILLSSVYNKMAYKRTPSSLYGADEYLEKHHIADDLVPMIHRLTTAVKPASAANGRSAADADEQEVCGERTEQPREQYLNAVNDRIQVAETQELAVGTGDEAVSKAQRLARIIVSDIALYNQERVEQGIRAGTFYELLADEIREGRKLFKTRVAPEIQSQQDYLQQAFDQFIERRRQDLNL